MGGLEMRMCTSLAPASYIMRTILTEVVPRTIESSTSTTRLSLDHGAVGVVLELARPASGSVWVGSMKVRPDIMVADDAELEGNAGLLREAERCGNA